MKKSINLKSYIRDIPDFPKAGIIFKDITTLLKDNKALCAVVKELTAKFKSKKIDKVVAVEARGFIFGGALAVALNAGFVPVRKKGKLPGKTRQVSYDLEYGTDTLEMHEDAIEPGERVLIVDDLLATGGTVKAVTQLVNDQGGKIVALAFMIELGFLHGREKLKGFPIAALIKY